VMGSRNQPSLASGQSPGESFRLSTANQQPTTDNQLLKSINR
jgi:hypothetical protein